MKYQMKITNSLGVYYTVPTENCTDEQLQELVDTLTKSWNLNYLTFETPTGRIVLPKNIIQNSIIEVNKVEEE